MPAVAGPSSSKSPSSSRKKARASLGARPAVSAAIVESDVDMSDAEERRRESSVDSDDIDSAPISVPSARATPVSTPSAARRTSSFPRYHPPPGMAPVNLTVAVKTSPFEYDALAAKPGAELWVIRVPADFKASRLGSLALSRPGKPGSKGEREAMGTLATKHTKYTLVPADAHTDTDSGSGAEMAGLQLFVPHARSGTLLRAPVPIKRKLILTPAVETDEAEEESAFPEFVPPVAAPRTQPTHLLKFRNHTYGFDTPGPAATTRCGDSDADGDDDAHAASAVIPSSPVTPRADKKSKGEKKEKKTPKSDDKGKDKDAKRKKRKSDVASADKDAASPARKKKKSKD